MPKGGGLYSEISTATLSGGLITDNQARGGTGGSGASSTGGNAQGGGIYSVGGFSFVDNNGNYVPVVAFSTVTTSGVSFLGNLAAGGAGGAGGGTGGIGAGGAAYNDAASTLSISLSLISLNTAEGGAGGSGGGSGGAADGGAIDKAGPDDVYSPSLPGTVLSLSNTVVIANLAQGGSAADGSDVGLGIGGGLYLAEGGTAALKSTVVAANFASTTDDNIYGTYTVD